ncbi:MAG: VCBS repeat-containing protein [Acidimicrobiales bacterium]
MPRPTSSGASPRPARPSAHRRLAGVPLALASLAAAATLVSPAAAGAAPRSAAMASAADPAPREEPGPDAGNLPIRDELGTRTPTADPPAGSRAATKVPASPSFGINIDDAPHYVGQSTCDPTSKPGVLAFRSLVLRTYPNTGDDGIVRPCSSGGQSEHKEGRGWDWKVSATSASQKATADGLIAWLLATDRYGNRWANARRLGVMYIIWDHRIWRAFDPTAGWEAYKGPDPHTGHVHFSFTWPGARQETTWWHPDQSTGLLRNPVVPTAKDFDANGADDAFFYAPAGPSSYQRWRSTPSTTDGTTTSSTPPPGVQPISGDLDGDGATDVIWYGQGSIGDAIWMGVGGARAMDPEPLALNGTYRPFVGDFDGNGTDDVFWYGPGVLPDRIWWGSPSIAVGANVQQVSVSGVYLPIPADVNGDGATDIEWYGKGAMPDAIWLGTPAKRTFTSVAENVDGDYQPFPGDFDGNGADDIFWYAPGTATDRIRWGERGKVSRSAPEVTVNSPYQVLVGDADGNGTTDILWYGPGRAADRTWAGKPDRTFVQGSDSVAGVYTTF